MNCENTTAYMSSSIFSKDIDRALNTLTGLTVTGFNTTSVGSITALALCRGDVTPLDCQSCVDKATSEIRQFCPGATSAQTWYSYCMIRYSNVNFLQKSNESILLSLYDTRQAPGPEVFDDKVQELIQNLSVTAGMSEKRFALGWTNVTNRVDLYGYLDCTRDLISDNCMKCLISSAKGISCCLGQWAVWLATPTCQIQFSVDLNFNLTLGGATKVFTDQKTTAVEVPKAIAFRSRTSWRRISVVLVAINFIMLP
ncbi:hypothetical protein GIB67_040743 [Kingdonia uniflora]|uniref:Gnk2-homologous domain-containing protein n=1 Tax=Kingdonia uniflora TaxID=39325 RepID=A0A7J7KUD8_9MAGN|nr:hypothetical protein GIB67_040743 [Kingdonia uniflora]